MMIKKVPVMTQEILKFLIKAQINELTESIIYYKLANISKDPKNKKTLSIISMQEKKHHDIWKSYTNVEVKPNNFRISFFVMIVKIFWLSFGIKLMEKWEVYAQQSYSKLGGLVPELVKIQKDEEGHEKKLIDMLNDKWLFYMWSIVLWLNDALVELTGVLAWLTLGLQNTNLIAVVGLITGISASFSMWASEYLSTKAEWNDSKALTSSLYTRSAYFITVVFLILPYIFIKNPFIALLVTMLVALIIIALFNRYVSIAQNHNFRRKFLEMAMISMGVAIISFGIGFVIRSVFGLEV